MRKTRSDCTVGTFEKKYGLPPGAIRNPDGRDTRSDKLIGTLRKEFAKKKHHKSDPFAMLELSKNLRFRHSQSPHLQQMGRLFYDSRFLKSS